MSWMVKWPGAFPVFVAEASGAHFRDVDGHDYVDMCLGDTGAMTGHSPPPTVATVREQVGRGITTMLPTEDSVVVSEELRRRFGLPLWQFTLSATDANRHVIRYARHITGRRKIVVHDHCYHGSVDETFADARRRGPHRLAPRQHRAAGRPGRDHLGGRVQRRRRAWSGRWPAARWPRCSPSRR